MVKLINNVPCKYVDQFKTDIEFILLHKILDNKKYREYYVKQKNNGKYKILDNGAFELGKGISDNTLLEWAVKLNVNEVIAPDTFKDKDDTLAKLYSFLFAFPAFKIQAVPQGNNQKELMECLESMLQFTHIDVIGFNKLWDRHSLLFEEAVRRVYSMGKEVHLLGVNNLSEWVNIFKSQHIRSADSRILSKIVSGQEDTWEVVLDNNQLRILKRLHQEILMWQK
jgi:hypothetical protein